MAADQADEIGQQGERGAARGWRWLGYLLPVALCLATVAFLQRPDGRLHLIVLDTPGDAILLQLPDGRFALIDGGGDPARLALLLGRAMPFWRRDLAAVILTAPDSQRLSGQIAALARYRPALALAPPELGRRGASGEWRRLAADLGVPLRPLQAGRALRLGAVDLRVLAASAGDEGGAVILVEHGAVRALIHTGGPAGDLALAQLADAPLALLVYPWQRELAPLAGLRPRATVFSPGYEADEPALLSYADRRRLSPAVYHPANQGSVELISDGRGARVQPRP